MATNQPSEERQWPRPTLSLRTLFLATIGAGVFFAVLRVSDGFLATSAGLAFLSVWFFCIGERPLANYARTACAVSLVIAAFVPREY